MTATKLIVWVCLLHTTVCLLSVRDQHLVRCVTNIAVRHFVPGRTVLLSNSADMDTELKTELLMHLHQTNLYSVVLNPMGIVDESLINNNITHHNLTDITNFIHPGGSLIIYQHVPCGKDLSWYYELEIQFCTLYGIDFNMMPPWDYRAKFIIIANNDHCRNPRVKTILWNIFNWLQKIKLFNSVVTVNNHRKRNTATEYFVEVYTHFVFYKAHACHHKVIGTSSLTLLDSWVMEGNGQFLNNLNLFLERNYNNFQRCPLRAIVRNGFSFVRVLEISDSKKITHVEGLEINLFKLIAAQLNATVQYHDYMPSFNDDENWSKKDVAKELFWNKADIAFGGLSLNSDGYKGYSEKTTTYYPTCWRWYVPCGVKSSRIERIFKILTPSLWIASTLTLVLVAIVMVYLAKKTPAECQKYSTVGSCLTEVLAVILGVSVSVMPRTPPLRLLFLSWVFFCFSFNMVFLSYLTTYMIEPGYEPPIQTMDQLLASELKLALSPSYEGNISEWYSQDLSSRTVETSQNNFIEKVVKDPCTALLEDEDNANWWNVMGTTRIENVNTLCPLEDGIVRCYGFHMFVDYRNPMIYDMNIIIRRAIEAGILDHWYELYYHKLKIEYHVTGSVNLLSQYYSYFMLHLSPPFIPLLTGYGLGLLMLVMELLCHRYLTPSIVSYLSVNRVLLIVRHFICKCGEQSTSRIVVVLRHIRALCRRRRNKAIFLQRDRILEARKSNSY